MRESIVFWDFGNERGRWLLRCPFQARSTRASRSNCSIGPPFKGDGRVFEPGGYTKRHKACWLSRYPPASSLALLCCKLSPLKVGRQKLDPHLVDGVRRGLASQMSATVTCKPVLLGTVD